MEYVRDGGDAHQQRGPAGTGDLCQTSEKGAGLGQHLRLERGDFRVRWHPGPCRYQASGAHPRPAGGAGTAEPPPAGLRYRRRRAGPDRLRRQPLDGAAQPRFLSAAPQRRARGIPGRPGTPEIRPRPRDRLRQPARFEPIPCRARAEAHRHPNAQLQPPRRPGLFRQRPCRWSSSS